MGQEGDGDPGMIDPGPPPARKRMLGTTVARERGTVVPERDPFTVMVIACLAWGYPGRPEVTWDLWYHVLDLFQSAGVPTGAEAQVNVAITGTRFVDDRRRSGVEPIDVPVRARQEVLRSRLQRFWGEDVDTLRLQSYGCGLIAVEGEPVLDAGPRTIAGDTTEPAVSVPDSVAASRRRYAGQ
jgi:hypothetical protein